jgi:hypothetical protein
VRLANARDVRKELAALYKAARAGEINVGDASKLGNLLGIIARVIETSELETELEALKHELTDRRSADDTL